MIFGIFSIICGVILIILGAMVFIGASQLSAGVSGMAIFFVLGVISLLEGIFSIRGARDASKIMPAWIFAIIGVIAAIIGLFTGGSLGELRFLTDSQYCDIRCCKQDQEIQKLNPITREKALDTISFKGFLDISPLTRYAFTS